ncbi:MAG: hypothetical protein ACKO2T_13295, partial [Microcystis aeruginosa]
MTLKTDHGKSHPVGATVLADGINFSLFSKYATAIELLLFDDANSPQPSQIIRLNPQENRTF